MNLFKSKDYQMILSAISEVAIIAYTDKNGRITFANKKFCEISGYTPDELHNKDHRILNSGFHSKEFFMFMHKTISNGQIWRGEIRNKNKNGSFYWVDTQIFPITDSNNQITSYGSIRFDITENKNMQNALMQMEKLASLGEISAVIAHEINNPLTVIELAARTLLTDIDRGVTDIDHFGSKIKMINKSTNQISKIVRGLKTISRNGISEDFSVVNLKTFMEDALSFTIAKCKYNDIFFKIGDIPDIQIECRPDQLSQILLNLINNAQDAIFKNLDKWIEISFEENLTSNLLVLRIADSGTGISESIAENILTPFFTTKEVGKGTGLGLSISNSIAQQHNGRLYFDKTVPNTTFILEIPLSQSGITAHKLEA
ncbi:MAG: PAS domain-containing sensor histidine kinase [Bacteriovorax sp.]|nr:PAS domain-containing sensor histidine kinase [Bacteriovorax sp.]